MQNLISAFDVVLHESSKSDLFGLVIIETMAAGKPVVAAAGGGALEIIEDVINGQLVPGRDSDAIAKAIFYIISNPDKAKQLGMAFRKRISKNLRFKNI